MLGAFFAQLRMQGGLRAAAPSRRASSVSSTLALWLLAVLVVGASARGVAGPTNDQAALKKTKDILAAFRAVEPDARLSPEQAQEVLTPLSSLLPRLSDRNQAVYRMNIGQAILEAEARWGSEGLGSEGTLLPKTGGLSAGESLLFDGIAAASFYELDCLAVHGYLLLVDDALNRQPPDLELAAHYLEAAAEPAEACDSHNPDSFDEDLWDARAQLALAWSGIYRQEGDRAAQLEALQAMEALADPHSGTSQTSQLRLLELRQDLGDITFGVERYEPFVQSENFSTRANARICQASLAIDRGEPDLAVAVLDALEQEPQLPSEPAMVPILHAYRARAALKRSPPDLDTARLELALIQETVLGVDVLDRQRATLTQIAGEVALEAGELRQAEQAFVAVLNAAGQEQELVWRAQLGLAEVCVKFERGIDAQVHLLNGLEVLERLRKTTALAFWNRPYLCQAQKIYDLLITLLIQQGLKDDGPVPSGSSLDPRLLRPTPDTLLALVSMQSSLSFASALLRDSVADTAAKAELIRSLSAMNSGELVSGALLRQSLEPRQVVYLYYPLPAQVLILEVRREGVKPYPVAFGEADRADVRSLLRALRGAPAGIPPELDRLGARLLAPIWSGLSDREALAAFVLLGELEKLPLPALRVGGRYLVERTIPYELPFLQALPLLPRPVSAQQARALVISAGDDLPFAEAQDELVKTSGFDLTSLPNATGTSLRSALEQPFGLVVIGSHAEAPTSTRMERSSSHVVFQPGTEAALLLEEDERFPASRLRECHFYGAQVILSACETRVGDARVLDHSQGALHRAVLEAGAGSVMASRWKVGDRATYALLAHLLPKAQEVGMARALAGAQRKLLEGQSQDMIEVARARLEANPATRGEPSLTEPWSWAGFTVIGRPE